MKKDEIRYHCRTLFAGFLRTLLGTTAAGMGALAFACFKTTTQESGYSAVCSFVAAIAFAALALLFMYMLGASKLRSVKKGRFAA